ncbi:MAG: tryptophan--tRNA ligase [Clostridiales bacterium]|jgi:tryptophanyl-tRNA synthetase|nr:tryptophan--tRNA ligase [Clostridiales bacterium]
MEETLKKTIFSGMQPSGLPSLGNYLGALKNWAALQDDYNCVYCIVDMHAITVRQDPAELRERARNLLTMYLACGIDPEKSVIYYQSHVSAHAELAWILNCYAYMGELSRMTQFKDKARRHDENVNIGLFAYPVLMAADILLYNADLVPVGEDQRQHLELCRDLADRFDALYGDVFTVPEAYIPKAGAKIMSLQDPEKKMSKSEDENDGNVIFLMDEPKVIVNKIKRSVTDSGSEVRYAPDKPGISNLLNIYRAINGETAEEAERDFDGKRYGDFKAAVAETVVGALTPIQNRYEELAKDRAYIDGVIAKSAEKARTMAEETLAKARRAVGFPDR